MKQNILLIYFLFLITNIYGESTIEFFSPEQLKAGMKGYALTVFKGLEPEKMNVEIIAYMPNRLTKAGMILVKLSGDNVKRSRVAAGMSGSPVYISNKLVGALAYTWANSRELMAGVVPIQNMISDKKRGQNTVFIPSGAKSIQTLWSLTGLESSEFLEEIKKISQNSRQYYGIEKFETVKSSRSNGTAPLKEGDAVAIKLIEGDINLSSIGTVTYVNGEDVYIYGHPMDSEGPISLPLSRAIIYDILASTELSFKLGSALSETIGSTVFDGLSSVYGRFDKKAPTIPVKISIINKEYTNTYNMKMVRSRKYLPVMMQEGIGAILERELGKNIEKQINLSWNIQLENNQIITNNIDWIKNTFFNPISIKEYWKNYISILWDNYITQLIPEKLTINVNIMDKPYNYYSLEGVVVPSQSFLVGGIINVRTILREFRGETIYTNISLKIPKQLEEGTYTLMIGDALTIETELFNTFPENYKIRTEKALLKELRKPIQTHMLQVILVDSSTGSITDNHFLKQLPSAKKSLFESYNSEGKTILSPKLIKSEQKMDNPILGLKSILIDIIKPQVIILD